MGAVKNVVSVAQTIVFDSPNYALDPLECSVRKGNSTVDRWKLLYDDTFRRDILQAALFGRRRLDFDKQIASFYLVANVY